MPSIVSDVSATLSIASSQWQPGPAQAQQTDGQPFAAMLDATTAAPTPPAPPPSPLPQSANQAPSPTAGNTAERGFFRPRRDRQQCECGVQFDRQRERGAQWDRQRKRGLQLDRQHECGVQFDRQREQSVQLDQQRERGSNPNTASSAPDARATFNPRSSANAGSNAPAGFKGSGNLKTNANTGFDPPTVTGSNTAPQSTPSVPPNAKAASGAKPQTAATAATINNADTRCAGECRPARGPTDWPAGTSNQIVFE